MDGGRASISRPWVGERYEDLRLLAVGANMNEHGGYEAIVDLVRIAVPELRVGKRRINFGAAGYAGTLVHHRLGAYAAVIAEHEGVLPQDPRSGFPSPERVAAALDFLAFSNQVKCSPDGDRSAPTAEMWEHCGAHVLRREIEVLRPRRVLLLGMGDNAWFFGRSCTDGGVAEVARAGHVQVGRASFGGATLEVVTVPHPAWARGGSSSRIIEDLRTALSAA